MTVTLDISDDIAVITIDDGGRNVINHEVLDALEPAWEQAEAGAKAIVLVGREGSFCAGYDIRVMTGADPKAAGRLGAGRAPLAPDVSQHRAHGRRRDGTHDDDRGCVAGLSGCPHRRAGAFQRHDRSCLNVPYRDAWPLIPSARA